MTNCRNCGAPIDIYAKKCPYCETPYEAPGGSETVEKLRRGTTQEKMDYLNRGLVGGFLTMNEVRKAYVMNKFDSDFNEIMELREFRPATLGE